MHISMLYPVRCPILSYNNIAVKLRPLAIIYTGKGANLMDADHQNPAQKCLLFP